MVDCTGCVCQSRMSCQPLLIVDQLLALDDSEVDIQTMSDLSRSLVDEGGGYPGEASSPRRRTISCSLREKCQRATRKINWDF
jgi:hypothetical protein